MPRTPREPRDPLRPIELATAVVLALFAAVLVLLIPATIFGSGSFLGLGDTEVCVTAPQSVVEIAGGGGDDTRVHGLPSHSALIDSSGEYTTVLGLRPGADLALGDPRICSDHASTTSQVWDNISQFADLGYTIVAFVLLELLVRCARREGLFTRAVSRSLARLGWFLVLGTVAFGVLRALAASRILADFVTPDRLSTSAWDLTPFFHVSVGLIVAGLGVVSMARVMARSVPMREELEATV